MLESLMRCPRPFRAALLFAAFAAPLLAAPLGGSPGAAAAEAGGADEAFERRVEFHLAALREAGPRSENSAGERAAIAHVERSIAAAGLLSRDYGLARPGKGNSGSRILEATVAGRLEERLVIAAPLDAHEDAAAGEGDAGLALALAAMERLAAARAAGSLPPVGVSFVFLGAERRGLRGNPEEDGYGSASWIAGRSDSTPLAVVYLALDALPGTVGLRAGGSGLLSPFWHYDRSRQALAASGLSFRIYSNRMQIERLGFSSTPSPLAAYLAAGIPAVELRVSAAGKAAVEGSEPRAGGTAGFARFVDALVQRNSEGFLSIWDRHYLSFQIGSRSLVIREKNYIAYLVGFCVLVAAFIMVFTGFHHEATRHFLRRLPSVVAQVFLLFAATALVYLGGRLFGAVESLLFGSGRAWTLAPQAFAAARIAASLFLTLALISYLVERGLLSPNPYFYEFAALLFLGADLFVFTAVQTSLVFYFVWAFVVVAASLAARRAVASLVAYALMYAPILLLLVELAVSPDLSLYGRLVSPTLADVLVLAAGILPFNVFTASPLLFFRPRSKGGRRREAALFILLALLAEGVAVGFGLAVAGAARQGGPASFVLTERLDQDAGSYSLEVSGARRVGGIELARGGETLRLASAGDRAVVSGADGGRWVSLATRRGGFLGRSLYRLELSFARPPHRLRLGLEGREELKVYDCSLPYEASIDGRSVVIAVPGNPGSPLAFDLAVPMGFEARLRVEAWYLEPLVPYGNPGREPLSPGSYSLVASFPLGGPAEP